jgi:hypothetical protein
MPSDPAIIIAWRLALEAETALSEQQLVDQQVVGRQLGQKLARVRLSFRSLGVAVLLERDQFEHAAELGVEGAETFDLLAQDRVEIVPAFGSAQGMFEKAKRGHANGVSCWDRSARRLSAFEGSRSSACKLASANWLRASADSVAWSRARRSERLPVRR